MMKLGAVPIYQSNLIKVLRFARSSFEKEAIYILCDK